MTTGGSDVVGPGALGAGIGHMPESWDLEADVVVIGAGATGLPAAIAAIDAGASVLVVEANYDIGGHAILSGGNAMTATKIYATCVSFATRSRGKLDGADTTSSA